MSPAAGPGKLRIDADRLPEQTCPAVLPSVIPRRRSASR
jgi:hypothetical protein